MADPDLVRAPRRPMPTLTNRIHRRAPGVSGSFALLGLVLATALWGCGGGPPQPSGMAFAMRADAGARKDFGHLWEGEVRSHTFRLESVGSEPIRVVERLDSCGCSSVEWFVVGADGERRPYTKGDPIPRGEVLELDVVFDSRGRSGDFDQPITLYVPFPQSPKIELRLAARIEPLLEVAGAQSDLSSTDAALRLQAAALSGSLAAQAGRFLDLGTVPAGQGASGRLELVSNAGAIHLRVVGPPMPDATLDLVPIEPGPDGRAERFELAVAILPEASAGVRLGSIELVSDVQGGDGRPVSSFVRVQAAVRGHVEAEPAYLDLDLVDAQQPFERSAALVLGPTAAGWTPGPQPTVEAELEAPEGPVDIGSWFTAELVGAEGECSVRLRCNGLPERPFGPFRGRIRVDLGLAAQPTLDIRFGGTSTGLVVPGAANVGARPPG
jgi:hypothetical protein